MLVLLLQSKPGTWELEKSIEISLCFMRDKAERDKKKIRKRLDFDQIQAFFLAPTFSYSIIHVNFLMILKNDVKRPKKNRMHAEIDSR